MVHLILTYAINTKNTQKSYGKNDYRDRIQYRTDIDYRSSIFDNRIRIGDWESDTMIDKSHKGAIMTLLERKSRLYLALPIAQKLKTILQR